MQLFLKPIKKQSASFVIFLFFILIKKNRLINKYNIILLIMILKKYI
jgi:hypothetical protein